MAAAIIMPLWNIPLISRILKRKSSEDISLFWVIGVWICIVAMLPSAIVSSDSILKTFGIANSVLFSGVLFTVIKFRNPKD